MQLPQCLPAGSPAWCSECSLCTLDTLLQAERNVGEDLCFGPEHLRVVTTLVPLTEQGGAVFLPAAPLWSAVWHTAFFVPLRGFKVNPLIQYDPFKKSKHYMLQEGNKALSAMNHVLGWSRGDSIAPNSSFFSGMNLS